MMSNGHMVDMKAANMGSKKVAHKEMKMVSNASKQVSTECNPQMGMGIGNTTTHKMGGGR